MASGDPPKVFQPNGARTGLKVPPKDASEFGGHAGMAEDFVPYGHGLTPAEAARYERKIDPSMLVDPATGKLVQRGDPIRPIGNTGA